MKAAQLRHDVTKHCKKVVQLLRYCVLSIELIVVLTISIHGMLCTLPDTFSILSMWFCDVSTGLGPQIRIFGNGLQILEYGSN